MAAGHTCTQPKHSLYKYMPVVGGEKGRNYTDTLPTSNSANSTCSGVYQTRNLDEFQTTPLIWLSAELEVLGTKGIPCARFKALRLECGEPQPNSFFFHRLPSYPDWVDDARVWKKQ